MQAQSLDFISQFLKDSTSLESAISELSRHWKEKELKTEQSKIKINELESENNFLREQIKLLKLKHFGRKSEVIPEEQLTLGIFNEAETIVKEEETVKVRSHTKRKKKKKQIPDDIERKITIIDLDGDKKCVHDGSNLVLVKEKKIEKLHIIPAHSYIEEIWTRHYECKYCDQQYSGEKPNLGLLPSTIATPSLLSYIVTAKYCNSLPLYRISQILSYEGINISRQTFSRWIIDLNPHLVVLINLLRERLLDSSYIRMDETPVQVLKEQGRAATSSSYMWVQQADVSEGVVILFNYNPSRSGDVPVELLDGYSGYLQVDGYVGYDKVEKTNDVIRIGCWDHVRRGFAEAFKLAGGKGISNDFLFLIKKLYKIEERIAKKTIDEKYNVRQTESASILKQIKKLANSQRDQAPPKQKIGQSIQYLLNQWPRLNRYIEDGRLSISNIKAENAIRPFAVGRKNWLFSDTAIGAEASATFYSLATTAKQNELNPTQYFQNVFQHLPLCSKVEEFERLLPLKGCYRPPT